jgi:hypothetical protein
MDAKTCQCQQCPRSGFSPFWLRQGFASFLSLYGQSSLISHGLSILFSQSSPSSPPAPDPPPQVINGQIVIDNASLTVQAQRSDDVTLYTRVEEDGRLINTQSYMKKTSG